MDYFRKIYFHPPPRYIILLYGLVCTSNTPHRYVSTGTPALNRSPEIEGSTVVPNQPLPETIGSWPSFQNINSNASPRESLKLGFQAKTSVPMEIVLEVGERSSTFRLNDVCNVVVDDTQLAGTPHPLC